MSKRTESKRAGRRQILYFVMLAISLGVQALIVKIGHTDRIIHILGNDMQISSLAGVVSTLGSLCALYMTITMKKKGFITALALLLLQLSILLVGLFFGRNPTALAGIFSVALMTLAVVFIYQRGKKIDRYQTVEMDALKARQKGAELLFEQTATALVNAIEAKDVYSRGHSLRVAEYSRRIAKQLGKSEEECNQI